MADASNTLKNTSSPTALRGALGLAMMPLPLAMMEMTHEGRIFKDGLAVGVLGLLSTTAGLPRDAYEFAREHIKGVKRATPENDRIMSSAWIEKHLMAGYDASYKFQHGHGRPEIRENSFDGAIHKTGEFVPLVGSLFIPIAGEARIASLVGSTAAKGVAYLPRNAAIADIGMSVTNGVEGLIGIERPTESSFASLAGTGFTTTTPMGSSLITNEFASATTPSGQSTQPTALAITTSPTVQAAPTPKR